MEYFSEYLPNIGGGGDPLGIGIAIHSKVILVGPDTLATR